MRPVDRVRPDGLITKKYMDMKFIISSFLLVWVGLQAVYADVRLPKVFGDGMVLQRNKPISVWGWADPGEAVTVKLNHQSKRVTAGNDGTWHLKLGAEKAGGPFQLVVEGKNRLQVNDVLIGEVWICSGQSNMEWPVQRSDHADQEIAAANYPQIRHIKLSRKVSGTPLDDIAGDATWEAASPQTVGGFTAVGYFYARELHRELGVPIGLINTSYGGTIVETWISREAMATEPAFQEALAVTAAVPVDSLHKAGPNRYPSLLFNAMVQPLIPYTIAGAIWYQGESNASRAYQYRTAFPLLIKDWRTRWAQGSFPFYFVQLASFKAQGGTSANGSTWAELREAQTRTLSLPRTGQAITTDIGETNDIHPKNKQDVGKRLAAIALADTYRKKVISSGPVFKKLKVKGSEAVVSFNHVYGGLQTKPGTGDLKGFEIAGADQQFKPATARIEGHTVIVSANGVDKPAAVRYSWADDAGQSNLFNQEGFPAEPFRTDSWTETTRSNVFKVAK